jgi:hypothetical protein
MRGQGEGTAGPPEGTEGLSSPTDGSTGSAKAGSVDVERFRASMDRLYNIYSEIALKADHVMENRCPYKDARSRCTAQFGCRNQFFTKDPMEKPVCAGSDRIDYRAAWVDGGAATDAHS